MPIGSAKLRLFRCAVLASCVLVALFTIKVKLAQYNAPSHGPTPVTASKLWMNGQKIDFSTATANAVVPCLAFLVFVSLVLISERRRGSVVTIPVPQRLTLFERHRFLRPPPSI